MTERITAVEMQAFRGIGEPFTLDLGDGRSCVILGDNGTGKSSIADAVEWYFTGRIEFLTREGRGGAIRHSGAADELDTKVTVTTGGPLEGAITESAPSSPMVREIGRSELFLLRGRTLADFIDKTKGEKWQVLSELLGLDAIDRLRLDLQTARNDLSGQVESARLELAQREAALHQWVGEVSEGSILEAIKAKCGAASIDEPLTLEGALDPEWRETITSEGSGDRRAAALRTALDELLGAAATATSLDPIDAWNQFLAEGQRDQLPLTLYRAADSLIGSGKAQDGICPLCHQPFSLVALSERLKSELLHLGEEARALETAKQAARQFTTNLHNARSIRTRLVERLSQQGLTLPMPPEGHDEDLHRHIDESSPMERSPVEQYCEELASWDIAASEAVESAIPRPDTERGQVLVDLGALLTSAEAWHLAVGEHEAKKAASNLADRLFRGYQERQVQSFTQIIGEISRRVAEIYDALHPEGGLGAVAIETVGEKGAELAVEFHGRRELPPHRVLSESHLNSLGIALFLAMAETFNERLHFLILDDVINSFDREHRGRLADLLVSSFSDRQLVVLTHDQQFFTRLRLLAPSWETVELTSWSFSEGPRTKEYQGDRLLAAAWSDLATDDRIGAAQKGRRALEEFLQEACEALSALLPFRRGRENDQRVASEVMAGLRRTLRDRAKTIYQEVGPLLTALEADLQASLNWESHASEGGTGSQEVRDALDRISELCDRFTCTNCETRIWHIGAAPAWRCKCGKSQLPPAMAAPGGGE